MRSLVYPALEGEEGCVVNRFLIALGLCFIFLSDCTPGECEQTKDSSHKDGLVIGLVPEQNVFRQLERYTPLAEYLSSKTGLKIKLKVLLRYGNVIDNFVSAGMDGAFWGSFSYVLAHHKIGVEALARPEDPDGVSTCNGLIFVRTDSGIRSIRNIKGKRFVFVDKASTAGYLFPLVYFKRQGIEDYQAYFKETYFAGTHEDVVRDVLDKKADIGAAKNTVFARMARADGKILQTVKILTRSHDLPENGLALSANVPASVKTSLQNTLLNMHQDPVGTRVLMIFGARRFVLTTNKDYEPVLRYTREAHLNLSQYDYVNH
jgi:phosphonate transport system substrate-binding protein